MIQTSKTGWSTWKVASRIWSLSATSSPISSSSTAIAGRPTRAIRMTASISTKPTSSRLNLCLGFAPPAPSPPKRVKTVLPLTYPQAAATPPATSANASLRFSPKKQRRALVGLQAATHRKSPNRNKSNFSSKTTTSPNRNKCTKMLSNRQSSRFSTKRS